MNTLDLQNLLKEKEKEIVDLEGYWDLPAKESLELVGNAINLFRNKSYTETLIVAKQMEIKTLKLAISVIETEKQKMREEITNLQNQIDILDTDNECLITNNAMLEEAFQLQELSNPQTQPVPTNPVLDSVSRIDGQVETPQEKSSRASIDVANEVSELSSHSPVVNGCGKKQGVYKCGDIIGKEKDIIIFCDNCSQTNKPRILERAKNDTMGCGEYFKIEDRYCGDRYNWRNKDKFKMELWLCPKCQTNKPNSEIKK